MARNPKQNENLKPIKKGDLTREEAKKRGHNGGVKSAESRRNKRNAKETIQLLLGLAAKDNLDKNLEKLGVEDDDRTNLMALSARMFSKAMSGDVNAYRTLMEYGGYSPNQELADRERLARIKVIEDGGKAEAAVSGDFDDGSNVVIYLPSNGRDKDEHIEQKEGNT